MDDDFSFLTEIEEEETDNLDNSSSLSTVADVPAEDDQFGFITALPDDEQPVAEVKEDPYVCLLYTSPSPRDGLLSRMPSSA